MSRDRRKSRPAQSAFIREIQRRHQRREPLNISAVKRGHPELIEGVYAVRPFWGWKRALKEAGLDYNQISVELRDYVDCKICGQDLGGLSYHLIKRHQATPQDYRLEYPDAELLSETMRSSLSKLTSRAGEGTLPHWEAIWTPEYVLDRMAELHRQNYPMNYVALQEHEPRLIRHAVAYFGSWDEALRRVDLDPGQIRLTPPSWPDQRPWWHADKPAIIVELRRRKAIGETLSETKVVHQKYGSAFVRRARIVFGSWANALRAAGLEPFGGLRSHWPKADKAAIVAEIRRRVRTGEPFRYDDIKKEKWGYPLLRRTQVFFGTWSGALIAAGIEPKMGRSPWPYAGKAEILAEIIRRKRAGRTLRFAKIIREHWGAALRTRAHELFGSWADALRAVGIEPKVAASPWAQANRAQILAEIRRRDRAGESMRYSKVLATKWGAPLLKHSEKLFGAWSSALLTAGIDLPRGTTSRWRTANKTSVLAEIRRRKKDGESLVVGRIIREQWGEAFWLRAGKLFGSWGGALQAAGFSCDGRGAFKNAVKDRKMSRVPRPHARNELANTR